MRRRDLGDVRAEIKPGALAVPYALRYIGDALVHLADVIGSRPAPVVHVKITPDDDQKVTGGQCGS